MRVLAVAGGSVIATTLMACYGPPPRPTEPAPGATTTQACSPGTDQDGDGACAPTDCDDRAPAVFPGAPDSAGDGIDQNCDGAD